MPSRQPQREDDLPSIDELLEATNWTAQLEQARARREAALRARGKTRPLPKKKPWEEETYLIAPAARRPATSAGRPMLTVSAPALRPEPRRRPFLFASLGVLVLGGVLSPGVAERMSLWQPRSDTAAAPFVAAHLAPSAPMPEPSSAAPRHPAPLMAAARPQAAPTPPAVPAGPGARPAAEVAGFGIDVTSRPHPPLSAPPTAAAPHVAVALPDAAPRLAAASLASPDRPGATFAAPALAADLPDVLVTVQAMASPVWEAGAGAQIPPPVFAVALGASPSAISPPGSAPDLPFVAGRETLRPILVFVPDGSGEAVVEDAVAALRAAGLRPGEIGEVDFRVSRTHVRHYHEADRNRAEHVAATVGGPTRDFTEFRPLPPPGTIEVWFEGEPAPRPAVAVARRAAPQPPVPVRVVRTGVLADIFGTTRQRSLPVIRGDGDRFRPPASGGGGTRAAPVARANEPRATNPAPRTPVQGVARAIQTREAVAPAPSRPAPTASAGDRTPASPVADRKGGRGEDRGQARGRDRNDKSDRGNGRGNGNGKGRGRN